MCACTGGIFLSCTMFVPRTNVLFGPNIILGFILRPSALQTVRPMAGGSVDEEFLKESVVA